MTPLRRSSMFFIIRFLNVLTLTLAVGVLFILLKIIPNPIAWKSALEPHSGKVDKRLSASVSDVESIPAPPRARQLSVLGTGRGVYETPELINTTDAYYRTWFSANGWREERDLLKAASKQMPATLLVYSKARFLVTVALQALPSGGGTAVIVMATQRSLILGHHR